MRKCMMCSEPLDKNGDCATPHCAFNPNADMEVYEGEELREVDESLHQEPTEEPDMPHPKGGDLELGEPYDDEDDLLDDSEEDGQPEGDPDKDAPHSDRDEVAEDSDKLDLSQEDLPDTDDLEGDFEDDGGDEGEQEKPEPIHADDLTPEEREQRQAPKDKPDDQGDKGKQLSEEEGDGEDPSDDAEDLPEDEGGSSDDQEDENLPPRPQGCNGDCKPGDPGQDGDPCPHCTAKSFQQEMEEQGKEFGSEGDIEEEFQNFLQNWQKDAEEELDNRLQDREPPELGGDHDQGEEGEGDDDLPPRPDGCQGNCQPSDQFDDDADPCPHCTAKQFRNDMEGKEEDGEIDLEDLTPDEIGDMFQDFLKDWADEQREHRQEDNEGEQKSPDEQNDEPPEDEMQDGEAKEALVCKHCGAQVKPEQRENGTLYFDAEGNDTCPDPLDSLHEGVVEQKKVEHEDESDEFKRVAKDLSVAQERRFDNLVERLEQKIEQMFGETADDIYVQAKQDGQFAGEEVSQSIQITSRGVTYWVTLSAAKEI